MVIVSVCPHLWRGVPHLRSGGVPHPRSGRGGSTPVSRMGYPLYRPGMRWVPQGTSPHPRLDGVLSPHQQSGVPPCPRQDGVPSHPILDEVPPTPISKTNTCYAAGGVPLVFTQENFLVLTFVYLEYFLQLR